MGITAPMNPVQTWIQALAETLGAAAILQVRFPGVPVDIFPHPKPADLATGGYAMGTPEMHLFDALKSVLLPHYGLRPPWGKSAVIGAAVPGPQAMQERASAFLLGYLHGYRAFDMAGAMSHGDVFSPVQLLLDTEAVTWAERYARGLEWTPEPADIERWVAIAGGDGLFADDSDEVARMRGTYRLPRLFPSVTAGQYLAAPRDAIAEAQADIARLIARHDVEPDHSVLMEINKIIDIAHNDSSS
jgi:trimethylamine:corrinoid methyltransferase-like protein